MPRRSTEGRRALFHYRESSRSGNNTDCIRGLDHVTLSYFITASFAPSCLILRLTFSRGLCHGSPPLLPLSVRAQINVLALRPHIPPLLPSRLLPPRFFFAFALSGRSEEEGGGEVKGEGGCREKLDSGRVRGRRQSNPAQTGAAEEHLVPAHPRVFHQLLVSRSLRAAPPSAGMKGPSARHRPSR